MNTRPRPAYLYLSLILALSGQIATVSAQNNAADTAPLTPSTPVTAGTAAPAQEPILTAVTVSASALALGSSDMILPFSVLSGNELVRKRAATLGETLGSEPGIAASHFGAGASRPIIRGLDGPRVRILSDGSEIMDASAISPDHAVATEPMLSRQIEVIRGPASLAYGGGATGGVINVLDNRIPTALPENGLAGSVELRAGSAAKEAAGAFDVTAGSGSFAVHAEGLERDARDYRVGRGWDEGRKVAGSHNQTRTGSLGMSWVGVRGYLGIAYTDQRNDYGLPGHEGEFADCEAIGDLLNCVGGHHHEDEIPLVEMRSERWDLRGDLLEPFAGFARLGLRASHTAYRHDEIEEGEVATRFRNKGDDLRLELEHEPFGGWRGVFGLQSTLRDFSAIGDEAYVQPTRTRRHAVFMVEEYRLADWRFEAALRHERQRIDVDSAQRDRNHRGTSVSLGANWGFAPGHSLAVSLSRVHRLPSAEELYAEGVHLATRTYERGNPDLTKETSHNLDLTLRKSAGDTTYSVTAFHNRIRNFVFARTLDEFEGFRLIEYTQRDAVFNGIEGEVRHSINSNLGIALFGDHVQGKLRRSSDDGRDLPRIPAWRAGIRMDAQYGQWEGDVELIRVGRQSRTARFESETAGYNMVNLGLAYNGQFDTMPYQFHLKLNNLTDKLAFNHASFIKDDAPLMGRNLTAGLRVMF